MILSLVVKAVDKGEGWDMFYILLVLSMFGELIYTDHLADVKRRPMIRLQLPGLLQGLTSACIVCLESAFWKFFSGCSTQANRA
jgi:hypothetical protein